MADPFKPAPWKYEPQSVRRAREVSSFRRLNDEIAPLVAQGDGLSLMKAQSRIQATQARADQAAAARVRNAQRAQTSEAVRKSLGPPPEAGRGSSLGGRLAGAFRDVVPRGVRNAVGSALQDTQDLERAANRVFALPTIGAEPQLGTRAGEAIERIPGVGGALRTGIRYGASPTGIAAAGVKPAQLAAKGLPRLAGQIASVPGRNVGERLLSQAGGAIGGSYLSRQSQALAERLDASPRVQQAAGLAGGLVGGGVGMGGGLAATRAATSTWKAAAAQRLEEALYAAAPEAGQFGRGKFEDYIPRKSIAGGAEKADAKRIRDLIAKRQKGESSIQTPEERQQLMNALGKAWGATTEAEQRALRERPETSSMPTDALTNARLAERMAERIEQGRAQQPGAMPTQGGMLGVPDQPQARPENMPELEQGQMFDRDKYRAGFKKAKEQGDLFSRFEGRPGEGAPPSEISPAMRERILRRGQQKARGEAPDVPRFPFGGEAGGAPQPGEPGYVAPGNLSARIPREQWVDPRELQVRPDLFQARDVAPGQSTDPRRVRQLVENMNPERFDPITVVRDPEGNPIVIAGHHRTAAALELGPERMPEVPIREISGDISTPEGRATLQNEAALSNFRDAPSNPREQYNTARTLEQNGQSVDEIAPQMRMTANKVQDILDIGASGNIVLDRVVQSPPTGPIAAMIGKAVRQWGVSQDDAFGLYERFTKLNKGETLPSPTVVWSRLQKLAPVLAEQPAMPGFEGLDLGPANTQLLDAANESLRLENELVKTQRKVRSQVRSVEELSKSTGIPAESLLAAGQRELETLRARLADVDAEVVARAQERAGVAAQQAPVQEGPGLFGEQPPPQPAVPEVVRPAAGQQVQLVRPSRPGARVEPGPMRLPQMNRVPGEVPTSRGAGQEYLGNPMEEFSVYAEPGALPSGGPRGPRPPENVPVYPEGYAAQPPLGERVAPPAGRPNAPEGYSSQPPIIPPKPPPTISGEQPEFSDYGRMAEFPETVEGGGTFREQAALKPDNVGLVARIGEYTNIPRTVVSGGDPSNQLRQQIMLLPANPKQAWHSVEQQFAAMKSQEALEASNAVITSHPDYPLLKGRLYLAPVEVAGKAGAREEAFNSAQVLAKWPFLGPYLRKMERGFTAGLNTMRAEVFYKEVAALRESGHALTPKRLDDVAGFINAASGRGSIPKWAQGAAETLNAGLFAPRHLIGRVQANAIVLDPRTDNEARKFAAKNLAAFYGAGASVLAVAAALGLPVELDPRSSDFGKLQLPNGQRIDFWAGNQQIMRLGAQLAASALGVEQGKSPRTGETYEQSWQETTKRFLRSKLAPLPSLGWDIASKSTFEGEELRLEPRQAVERALDLAVPMFINDFREALVERGVIAAVVAGGGSALGLGITTPEIGVGDEEAQAGFGKPYARLTSAERSELSQLHPDIGPQLIEQRAKMAGETGQAAKIRATEMREQLASDANLQAGKITRQAWNNARTRRNQRRQDQLELTYGPGEAITDAEAAKDPQKLWLRARKNATDPATGELDEGAFEREKASWTPQQRANVDKSLGGIYDTPMERLRGQVAQQYYALPEYRGYTAGEARQIESAWQLVRAGARSANELDMRRAMRQAKAEGGPEVTPRIWTAVSRRIAGQLPQSTARKQLARKDPVAGYFFGERVLPSNKAAVERALAEQGRRAA